MSMSHFQIGARQQNNRQQAGQHDGQGRHGAFFVGAARGLGIKPGGQRFEVERPQQQRGGQFFHGVDEHQQRAGGQRRAQQRQMHAAQRAASGFAQQARGLFQRRRNARQAGFDAADRHRQKAHGVRADQGPH